MSPMFCGDTDQHLVDFNWLSSNRPALTVLPVHSVRSTTFSGSAFHRHLVVFHWLSPNRPAPTVMQVLSAHSTADALILNVETVGRFLAMIPLQCTAPSIWHKRHTGVWPVIWEQLNTGKIHLSTVTSCSEAQVGEVGMDSGHCSDLLRVICYHRLTETLCPPWRYRITCSIYAKRSVQTHLHNSGPLPEAANCVQPWNLYWNANNGTYCTIAQVHKPIATLFFTVGTTLQLP